jgi:hypothetical protein
MVDRLAWKFISAKLIMALVLLYAGCAATQPNVSAPTHFWTAYVIGMIKGKMTLGFQGDQNNEGDRSVSGMLMIKIDDTSGGFGKGNLKGTFVGEINDGLIDASFRGLAFVSDGQASVAGTLQGTLSNGKGQGNWQMPTPTEAGELSGDWTLSKQQ